MGVKAKFTRKDISQSADNAVSEIHTLMIQNLSYVGEYATSLARNHGNYKDQTGNLRSSIGYVIGRNGKKVSDGGFGNVTEGVSEGRRFAESLITKTRGYTLIVVAGMHYGKYVEKRNYEVLTFTEAQARIIANDLFKSMFQAA